MIAKFVVLMLIFPPLRNSKKIKKVKMKFILALLILFSIFSVQAGSRYERSEPDSIRIISPIHKACLKLPRLECGSESSVDSEKFENLKKLLETQGDKEDRSEEIGQMANDIHDSFVWEELDEATRPDRHATAQTHHDIIAAMALYHLGYERAEDAYYIWLSRRVDVGWLSEEVKPYYKQGAIIEVAIVKEKPTCCCLPFFK